MKTGPNVIVFGETGVGKSSVINMLFDSNTANLPDSVFARKFHPRLCKGRWSGHSLNVYDTPGLDECDSDSVNTDVALENLTQFVRKLGNDIDLLIMCIKTGRINRTTSHNYRLLHDQLLKKHVPIILVVTHCELDDPIDAWRVKNDSILKTQLEMEFDSIICVTTVNKGEQAARFKEKYKLSRKTLCHSVARHLSQKILASEWITAPITITMRRTWNIIARWFSFPKIALHTKIYSIFRDFGFRHDEAIEKTNILFDQ